MDLTQKSSESSSPAIEAVQVKSCADCETTRTPLWRSGPAGPRSLCNACGIRQRKRRRALLGLGKVGSEKMKKKNQNQSQSKKSSSEGDEMGVSVKVGLVELGRKMVMQRSWGRKKKMREEEEAAMLLMALSCGSVFA